MEESTNVVNVDFCIFDILEDAFHYFLSVNRGALKTHGEYIVFEFTKGCCNGA
jgi:hypothetical protein